MAGRQGSELPDYYRIVNPKPTDGDAYVMSVSTDPYTTVQECEAKIPEVIQSAVDQFVEKYLRRKWAGYVQLSPDQLRQLVVAEYRRNQGFFIWQNDPSPPAFEFRPEGENTNR